VTCRQRLHCNIDATTLKKIESAKGLRREWFKRLSCIYPARSSKEHKVILLQEYALVDHITFETTQLLDNSYINY